MSTSHWTGQLDKLQRPDESEAEWTARTGGTAAIPDPFVQFRDQTEEER